jgi:hypothetical protein
LQQALDWQEFVYQHLPPRKNDERLFGPQFVVGASGDLIRHNERLLRTSTSLSVEKVAVEIESRGGLCIAAHINRPAFSLLANLGLVPDRAPFSAMEITRHATWAELQSRHPSLSGYSFIRSGDAHCLSDISSNTTFTLREPTLAEISMALRRQNGRRVQVRGNGHHT